MKLKLMHAVVRCVEVHADEDAIVASTNREREICGLPVVP